MNKKDLPIGITYYLSISQKQTYTRRIDSSVCVSNLSYMEEIAILLKSKVVELERKKSTYLEKSYIIRSDKIESKILLFDYLNKYPLFGYKHFAQVNLYKIHELVRSKGYKTIEGKNTLYPPSDSPILDWGVGGGVRV